MAAGNNIFLAQVDKNLNISSMTENNESSIDP